MPVKHGSDIAMTVTVHNAALKTIDNFTWGYETGDEKNHFPSIARLIHRNTQFSHVRYRPLHSPMMKHAC